jgi:hypothetical protein
MLQDISKSDGFGLRNGNGSRFASEIPSNGTSDDMSKRALVQQILRRLSVSDHGNEARGSYNPPEIPEQSSAAISVNEA